jgi:capsular exopolysaccharide synthesis family protein
VDAERLIRVVVRRRRSVALTAAVALLVAVLITLAGGTSYDATATLRVATQPPAGEQPVRVDDLAYQDRVANTYARILGTRPIREELARRLGDDRPPDASVTLPANTELLQITASDGDPADAARAANALAAILVENVSSPGTVSVVEAAEPPGSPSSPNWVLNLVLAGVLGLLGGVALAVLLERHDTRLDETRDFEVAAGSVVLAEVPAPRGEPLAVFNTGSPQEEAFRALRGSLLALERHSPLHTLLVTGLDPGVDASVVAANAGSALAQTGRSVLVADADLRHPALHRAFGLPGAPGIAEVLRGDCGVQDALQRTDQPGLSVLAAGPPVANPGELLGSPGAAGLVESLAVLADTTLVVAPPLLEVADAELLAPASDAVVLVVHRTRTRRTILSRAARRLSMLGVPLAGMVVVSSRGQRRAEPSHRGGRRHRAAVGGPR